MYLFNPEKVRIDESEILDYLLNPFHPSGRIKARFFLSFGFSKESWQELMISLKNQAKTGRIKNTEESDFGMKYIIEGSMDSPDGRNPEIITVWIIEKGGNIPRLITAYQVGRREK